MKHQERWEVSAGLGVAYRAYLFHCGAAFIPCRAAAQCLEQGAFLCVKGICILIVQHFDQVSRAEAIDDRLHLRGDAGTDVALKCRVVSCHAYQQRRIAARGSSPDAHAV